MGFDFNPTLLFVCRFCRHSFVSAETLKEHKLACHLGECLQIKCIIFEERLLLQECVPEHNSSENHDRVSNAKLVNRSSLKECGSNHFFDNSTISESVFKNPYVSLTRITEHEISHKPPEKKFEYGEKLGQRPPSSKSRAADKRLELSKQNLHSRADRGEISSGSNKSKDNEVNDNRNSVSYDDIHSEQQLQLKKNFPIYDVSTPLNSRSVGDEDAQFKYEDVKDREFIVASVSSNTDGVPRVQFASTLIPASAQEAKLLQKHPLIISSPGQDTPIAESDHLEILSVCCMEANESNSNSTSAEIRMNTELEPGTDELIQHEECQSTPATGETVAKPYMCETCFAFFRTTWSLNAHMLCHSSSKPFICSKCPSKFKRSSDLRRHQIVHGRETNFKCRFCNKCFSDNPNLVSHERTHTGDKPFRCPAAHCEYAASNNSTLNAHARACHSEELGLQQFVCPTCGKTYGLRRSLAEHIQVHHSDTTPFHCTHQGCSRAFKLKKYLRQHRKVHK